MASCHFRLADLRRLVLRMASCEAAIDEGGLPGHRSERQAPRRQSPTIIPGAFAEPPCELSVFGEPARQMAARRHRHDPPDAIQT
jgi:hypothetical protein